MKPNRTVMDVSMISTRRSAEEQLEGTMFDLAVAPRDVRIDPPSQPGSASSERGAADAKKRSDTQMQGILAVLAKLPEGHCLSRDEIMARTGLSVNAACGRLDTLAKVLHHVDVVESGAVSVAGNTVNGYRLSELGRGRITMAVRA
jgi:hypothetical protein